MENLVCDNTEDLFGNKYNTKSENLIIIKITPKNLFCLTRNELKMILSEYNDPKSPPAIEYSVDGKDVVLRKENPKYWFYKLPNGFWVDYTLKDAYDNRRG